MKKHDRIALLVSGLSSASDVGLDSRYAGYFVCFNAGQYYEAHDVLEDLWLETKGAEARFFKGLIQVAGAFVHLQKQFEHPAHPKHGRRLRPATRLFQLATTNLLPYSPAFLRLDVRGLCALCDSWEAEITEGDFQRNPWTPAQAPQLALATANTAA